MTEQIFEDFLAQADTAARNNDWATTHDLLLKANQIHPEHTGALTGIGTCLMQMQRAQEALPIFAQVIKLAPESTDAHNNLGVAYMVTGQFALAETSYKKAIELSPDSREPWKNLAFIYLKQDDRLQEGVQILAALVKSDPNDTDTLMLLGECYEMADNLESARVLYQKTLEISPDLSAAQMALERIAQKAQDAVRIARPEHAQKLAALKNLKKKTDQ
jgi:Flp pilus assembly protein TadD